MSKTSEVLLEIATKQTTTLVASQLPILALPLISPLASFVISKILQIAFEKTELAIYMANVDQKTQKQATEFIEAKKKASVAQGPEETKKAQDELRQKQRDLLTFDFD
jgi:hypothetical protein